MSNFSHNHNRQSDDVTSENDLDQFLNHLVASDGPPDVNRNDGTDGRDPDSLTASADAFHRRLEVAEQTNMESSQPALDLWGRILNSHAHERKEPEMSTASIALKRIPQRQSANPRNIPTAETRVTRFGRWASAIAAVFLVIAIGAGIWFSGYGPGGGDQSDGPPRYAALGVTPEASPSVSADWNDWLDPQDCAVEPLGAEDYASIMRSEPTPSSRTYAIIGTPEPDVALAVAETATEHEACTTYRLFEQWRSLESPAYIYDYSSGSAVVSETVEEQRSQFRIASEEISTQYPLQNPTQFIAVTSEEPPQVFKDSVFGNQEGMVVTVFDSDRTVLLEDGRVAIPGSRTYWSENSYAPTEDELQQVPYYSGPMQIYTNESGAWLLDETLVFCLGQCADYWSGARPAVEGTPLAAPTQDVLIQEQPTVEIYPLTTPTQDP